MLFIAIYEELMLTDAKNIMDGEED